jgi:hypothetical protein
LDRENPSVTRRIYPPQLKEHSPVQHFQGKDSYD